MKRFRFAAGPIIFLVECVARIISAFMENKMIEWIDKIPVGVVSTVGCGVLALQFYLELSKWWALTPQSALRFSAPNFSIDASDGVWIAEVHVTNMFSKRVHLKRIGFDDPLLEKDQHVDLQPFETAPIRFPVPPPVTKGYQWFEFTKGWCKVEIDGKEATVQIDKLRVHIKPPGAS